MKRVLALALATTMIVPALPASAASPAAGRAAGQTQGTGGISGTATSSTGQALPNYTVQIRNLQTGELAGSTTSDSAGSFTFGGLTPANYVIEIVNSAGTFGGSIPPIAITAGQSFTVTATAETSTLSPGGALAT